MIYNIALWGWANNGTRLDLGTVSIYYITNADGSELKNWEWNGFKGRSDGGTWEWVDDGNGRVKMNLTSNISKNVISSMGSWLGIPATPFFIKNKSGENYWFEYLGTPSPPVAMIFPEVL